MDEVLDGVIVVGVGIDEVVVGKGQQIVLFKYWRHSIYGVFSSVSLAVHPAVADEIF